jgi:hypothetical protein
MSFTDKNNKYYQNNKKFWEELIRLLSLHVIYLKYTNPI